MSGNIIRIDKNRLIEGQPEPLWRYRDLAKFLNMTEGETRQLKASTDIPYIQLSERRIRFQPAAVIEWLKGRTIK